MIGERKQWRPKFLQNCKVKEEEVTCPVFNFIYYVIMTFNNKTTSLHNMLSPHKGLCYVV